MPAEVTQLQAASIQEQVLDTVRDLLTELGKHQAARVLTVDSSFERDLGMGSLDLVELLIRCEAHFEIRLPDELAEQAETPAGWVRAIQAGGQSAATQSRYRIVQPTGEPPPVPRCAVTLLDVLRYYAERAPDRTHTHLLEDDSGQSITYTQLLTTAAKVASALHSAGLRGDDTVAIMLPTGADFFYAFFGVMLAGGIAVPVYPPTSPDKIEEYVRRQVQILGNAGIRFLITFDRIKAVTQLLRFHIPTLIDAATVPALLQQRARPRLDIEPSATALLQYTSGSTGDPKGVILSHSNILANVRAIGAAVQVRPGDAVVSWLPLYSDLGLIGSWVFSLYHALPITLMPPLDFLNRPERWLWTMHDSKGTLSAAPNFAYELCARKVPAWMLEGLDLSAWRVAVNAGEAVLPETITRFTERLRPFGFRPESFLPCYGLAECTVALAVPPVDRRPAIDTIRRESFEKCGRAEPDTNGIKFFSVGSPLPEHDVRLVDEQGVEVSERQQGRLLFRGPSQTAGYYGNTNATSADGWIDSGDLAYCANGELFITGRCKDCIIRSGRNISPEDVERAAGEVPGVERGAVAAFGVTDPDSGTEQLVVAAETRATIAEDLQRIEVGIFRSIDDVLGTPPDHVELIPLGALPKTSNGKIRRSETRALYANGTLHAGQSAPWLQFARLKGQSVGPWLNLALKQASSAVNEASHSAAMWMAATAGQRDRQACLAAIARVLRLNGQSWLVHNAARIASDRPTIYIANRASLLDPLILLSILPEAWLADQSCLANLPSSLAYLLRRLVARGSIEPTVTAGESVLVLAENRIGTPPMVSRYRLDAFQASIATSTPIQPIAIRQDAGELHVSIGDPVIENKEVAVLREQIRGAIAALC